MRIMVVLLGLTAGVSLSGCVVASVVGAAASVTGSVISTTVDVVTGGSDDEDDAE